MKRAFPVCAASFPYAPVARHEIHHRDNTSPEPHEHRHPPPTFSFPSNTDSRRSPPLHSTDEPDAEAAEAVCAPRPTTERSRGSTTAEGHRVRCGWDVVVRVFCCGVVSVFERPWLYVRWRVRSFGFVFARAYAFFAGLFIFLRKLFPLSKDKSLLCCLYSTRTL